MPFPCSDARLPSFCTEGRPWLRAVTGNYIQMEMNEVVLSSLYVFLQLPSIDHRDTPIFPFTAITHGFLPQYVYFRFLKCDHEDDWLVCQAGTMPNQILLKRPSILDVLELFSSRSSPRLSSPSPSSFISSSPSLCPLSRKKLIDSNFLSVRDNEIHILKQRTVAWEGSLWKLGGWPHFCLRSAQKGQCCSGSPRVTVQMPLCAECSLSRSQLKGSS